MGDHLDANRRLDDGCECVVSSLQDDSGVTGSGGALDTNCDGADGSIVSSFYVSVGGDDLPGRRLLHLHPVHTLEGEQLRDLALFVQPLEHRAGLAQRQQRHPLSDAGAAALDAPDPDATEVRGIVECREQHLERTRRVADRWGDRRKDRLK